jgi:hypothetical protein
MSARAVFARIAATLLLAASLGGCSHIGAAWNNLWDRDSKDSAAAVAPASAAPAAAPSSAVCATLRANASPEATPDAASRQMAVDEMKRAGCSDIPAS